MLNLQWNIEGKVGEFQTPAPQYVEFLKQKRNELYMLGLTNAASWTAAAFAYAGLSGDLTLTTAGGILAW